MNLDKDKLAEVAMAMLALTMFKDGKVHRAWKGLDWDVLDELCERGWIYDPKGKARSVVFTDEGHELALAFLKKHFADEPVTEPERT